MSIMNVEAINVQKLLSNERVSRGMTYEELANELGCSSSYLFRIEKGKRKRPSYELVGRMIRFFELSNDSLKKYMDGDYIIELSKEEELKTGLLHFVKDMDVNNFEDIQELLCKVKSYQEEIS